MIANGMKCTLFFSSSLSFFSILVSLTNFCQVITKFCSERIAKYAFEYAYLNNRKKVTAVHKANIMKLADGLFLESCREVASKYPGIQYNEIIVDNCCMQLVAKPEQFDVMVCSLLHTFYLEHHCLFSTLELPCLNCTEFLCVCFAFYDAIQTSVFINLFVLCPKNECNTFSESTVLNEEAYQKLL